MFKSYFSFLDLTNMRDDVRLKDAMEWIKINRTLDNLEAIKLLLDIKSFDRLIYFIS